MGRFACDWHRLPGGCLPGNHRPEPEPARIIATDRNRAAQGPGRRQQSYFLGSGLAEDPCASPGRCSGRQDVVDEENHGWSLADRRERADERSASLRSRPSRLRRGLDVPLEESSHVETQDRRDRSSEHFGLVEPPLSAPPLGQGHPRHHRSRGGSGKGTELRVVIVAGRRRPQCHGHEAGQLLGKRPVSTELEPHQSSTRRTFVQEYRARPGDGRGRAVTAPMHARLEGPPAPAASRAVQDGYQPDAVLAEG